MRAEDFFRHGEYWSAWSTVPAATADIGYALAAVDPRDCRILDVPCGHGRLLQALIQRAPKAALVGIDVNESTIQLARGSLRAAHVAVGSVYELPFPDRFFDVVLCHESFMHFDRPKVAIEELARVSGARLYFSVTTRRQLNTLLRRIRLLGSDATPHWTYNIEDLDAVLPLGFRWKIVAGFLVGRKALRLSHRAHLWVHRTVGRAIPQSLLRHFGQSLFIYGSRVP